MDDTQNIPTQQTRDTMAQADHDSITELKVLVRSVLDEIKAIKDQMKDTAVQQATIVAGLKAEFTTQHNGLDNRIRKLEDYAVQYVPLAASLTTDMATAKADIIDLKTNRSEVIAGWKVALFILGGLSGFISLVVIILQLLFHFKMI